MKIDNGSGGSQETSTGKPEGGGERGREPINFFVELKRRQDRHLLHVQLRNSV